MNPQLAETLILEKHFWDGRRAQVIKIGGDVLARVFTSTGRPYLEVPYSDICEATTTIFEWDGNGWPSACPDSGDR
jgi:hypothetical protein